MTETNVHAISWLHGLQDYFEFTGRLGAASFCRNFLKVLYSENKAPVLRNSIIEGIDLKDVEPVVNFFAHTVNDQDNMKIQEIASALQLLYPQEPLLEILARYYRIYQTDISDAFSRGQVNSKIWMTQELAKISKQFQCVHVYAGWMGQTRLYFDAQNIRYDKMRIFDKDRRCCEISDYIFNLDLIDDYRVKAVEQDIIEMVNWCPGVYYDVENYKSNKVYNEKTTPDLIVNTSAEHMSREWYQKFLDRPLDSDPLFVIQSNNLFEVAEHVNCVHSAAHLSKLFPMSRILFQGEKELFGYKRFMMIGRP